MLQVLVLRKLALKALAAKNLLILIATCSAINTAWCIDRVELVNGDRISGTIIKKTKDTLTIKTAYSKKIAIVWTKVKTLTLSKTTIIRLKSQTVYRGKVIIRQGTHYLETDAREAKAPKTKLVPLNLSDIQTIRTNSKPKYLSGYIKLASSFSSGNTDNTSSSIDFELVYKRTRNRHTLSFADNRSEENNIQTLENTRLSYKYDRFLAPRRFWYLHASAYTDSFKDIDMQLSTGLGLGYQIWSTPQSKFSFEAGFSHVKEDLISSADRSYTAFRWGARYEKNLKWHKLKLFHKQTGLWDLNNTNNITINSQSGFAMPLYKHLVAAIQINTDWDADPEPGKKKTDNIVLFSVSYKW